MFAQKIFDKIGVFVYKNAAHRGFIDACTEAGVSSPLAVKALMKVANYIEKQALSPQHQNMLIGGLGGAGLGAGIGGLLGGWRGAGIGGLAGGGIGAATGLAYNTHVAFPAAMRKLEKEKIDLDFEIYDKLGKIHNQEALGWVAEKKLSDELRKEHLKKEKTFDLAQKNLEAGKTYNLQEKMFMGGLGGAGIGAGIGGLLDGWRGAAYGGVGGGALGAGTGYGYDLWSDDLAKHQAWQIKKDTEHYWEQRIDLLQRQMRKEQYENNRL